MRYQLHQLELVFPPISNQEAEWLKNDKDVQTKLSKSHLYFIGQKPESFFTYPTNVVDEFETNRKLFCTYLMNGQTQDFHIDIDELVTENNYAKDLSIEVEFGDKLIRIWSINDNSVRQDILEWFTTEKILFDVSRAKKYIKDFIGYERFVSYSLHYVGISKVQTSLERLLAKPHDKRLRILSNEFPLTNGSRLTDEIVLFFFRVKSLEIKEYSTEEDFDNFGFNELENYRRIIEEAERAFVKIMNTEYNKITFDKYPKYLKGLNNSTVERYTFSIDEDIKFTTSTVEIVGKRGSLYGRGNEGDFIFITKESVELVKIND